MDTETKRLVARTIVYVCFLVVSAFLAGIFFILLCGYSVNEPNTTIATIEFVLYGSLVVFGVYALKLDLLPSLKERASADNPPKE